MAQIVAGITMSHSPLIMTNEERGGEAGQRFIQTAKELKDWLRAIGTDVIVLVSDDHFNTYYYDHMPAFTIGLEECQGWGDWDLPKYNIPVQRDLARHILDTAYANNFDFAYSLAMKVDHGHTQVIYFLDPDLDIPVVPIAVNTVAPPQPSMDRCFQVGEMIRKAIDSWNSDKKVAIVASGGLSHWVPIPKMDSTNPEDQAVLEILKYGREKIPNLEEYQEVRKNRVTKIESGPVNEEWDREFLRLIMAKDFATLRSWSSEYISENGGNGAQEIRNWLVLLGALQNFDPSVVYYEPITGWVTGMGIMRFTPPA